MFDRALAHGERWAVERYICQVFGKDCKMALAVSLAENGTRQCDRASKPNTNGTTDWGVFQVNEIHLKKGYTIKELANCKRNIEIAYAIYKGSGWNAWTTYKTQAYTKFLQ